MGDITDGQRFALNKLVGKYAKDRQSRLYLISALLEKEVKSTSELSTQDWRKIRNMAYKEWGSNDWTVCGEFESECDKIYNKYEEEVLGQLKLF